MTASRRFRCRTSEAVTRGHSDKIADQVADAIVDAVLEQDPRGRCGVEVMVNAHFVVVSGEFKTQARLNVPEIVSTTIDQIGYVSDELGFTSACPVISSVRAQSPEISAVIDRPKNPGAADQEVMYGFACDEHPSLMPLTAHLSHLLCQRMDELRLAGILPYLRPDGKSQVTVEYDGDDRPVRVRTIVLAAQHHPDVDIETIRRDLRTHVVEKVVPAHLLREETEIIVNRLGRFVLGGPQIDTGVTGRRLTEDTYGGVGRTGGGALSGKDPSKLDRTAAYYGRYVAKNIVAAGLARRCQVEVAYAFGEIDPVATEIETFGTSTVPEREILDWIRDHFSFRPSDMVEELDLRRPIYRGTAMYGHFGWEQFPWERLIQGR